MASTSAARAAGPFHFGAFWSRMGGPTWREIRPMMIQSAPPGEPHFLCWMKEHNALCGQFVSAFGNDAFERCEPFEQVSFAVSHHDWGWEEFDHNPVLDPESGLPRGIGGAPAPGGSETGRRSADINEAENPYSGLISSMHSWGLYHDRYGFSEFRIVPGGSTSIPLPKDETPRRATVAMLDGEVARQKRLREAIAADPAMRDWLEEKHVAQNYKQLQFFDTLALYFHLRHESHRKEEVFVHVPRSADEDASITITPKGDGVYAMSPFPFAGDRLETTCQGRYFTPYEKGAEPDDLGAALRALPPAHQTYTLVAA
jgi:hypothetical protein